MVSVQKGCARADERESIQVKSGSRMGCEVVAVAAESQCGQGDAAVQRRCQWCIAEEKYGRSETRGCRAPRVAMQRWIWIA